MNTMNTCIPTNPVQATEFNQLSARLDNCILYLDELTVQLRNKIGIIKNFDPEPVSDVEKLNKEPMKPQCMLDSLNIMLSSFEEYNKRLSACISHLDRIV
jgi:hypothetical protein